MEWTRVLQYLREGENLSTKFLAVVNNDQDIGPIVCGMANTIGGKIFIGMDPHNFHLNGTTIDEEWIQQMIDSFFHPLLSLQIEVIVKNDKRILFISVPSGQEKPYYYRDICYVMDNKQPRKASKEQVDEFSSGQQAQVPFDHSSDFSENKSKVMNGDVSNASSYLKDQNPFAIAASYQKQSLQKDVNVSSKASQQVEMVFDKMTVKSKQRVSTELEEELEIDLQMITDELIDLESGVSAEFSPKLASAISTQTDGLNSSEEDKPVAYPVSEDTERVKSDVSFDKKDVQEIESSQLKAPDFVPPESKVTYIPESIQLKKEAQLNDRQKKALYFLNTEPFIKNKMYRELFDVSHKTAHLELVDLMGKGFIFQEGSGRSTCYKKL